MGGAGPGAAAAGVPPGLPDTAAVTDAGGAPPAAGPRRRRGRASDQPGVGGVGPRTFKTVYSAAPVYRRHRGENPPWIDRRLLAL